MSHNHLSLKFVRLSIATLLVLSTFISPTVAQEPDSSGRAGIFERNFRRLDRNGDDKVTQEEAGDAAWFERFDLDRNGVITLAELRQRNRQTDNDIQKHLDLEYGKSPAQRLDVYSPRDAKHAPVMIYIHGGAWRAGDKAAIHAKPEYFAKRGWVFVSLNYRFVPQVDILTQLQDSAQAVAWVHDQIAKYGGNPAQIHLMGHSAGAHHAAILGTNPQFLKQVGKELSILKSVTELDTLALDLVRIMENEPPLLHRQAFGTDAEVWRQISPIEHIAKDQQIPPFFLVVAASHPQKLLVAEAFQKKLQQNGIRCDFVKAPEHSHGSVNQSLGLADDKTTVSLGKFLDALEAKPIRAEQEK